MLVINIGGERPSIGGLRLLLMALEMDEAEGSFNMEAHRRLGNMIVYLEGGPIGMFSLYERQGPATGVSNQLPSDTRQESRILYDLHATGCITVSSSI